MPDPITHASVSLVIARHWFRDRKGLFVLAALSPDLDVAIGGIFILLAGPFPTSVVDFTRASLVFHPSLSAAVWFLPFYSLLMSWGFRGISPKGAEADFGRIYTVVLAGMLLHIGLDLTQTGNRPLWPLGMKAGLDILPISKAGRIWTVMGALVLLIMDSLVFFRSGRCR